MQKGMKLIEVRIVNNRLIKCFNVQLDGKNMKISGDSNTGKSTAAGIVWDMLTNRADSITHGEKKGETKLHFSDGENVINATRTFTAKGSTISIADGRGNKLSMAYFKQLFSELSVNPHQIANMKPGAQLAMLAKSADLGDVDLGKIDTEIATAKDNRLDLYRQVELLAPGAEPEKVAPVDVSALVAEKHDADSKNSERERKGYELTSMVERGKEAKTEIERLGAELRAKMEANEKLHDEAEKLSALINSTAVVDTTELLASIDSAQATNDAAAAHRNWTEANKRHEAKTEEHKASDTKVKELEATKKAALDGAKWPIKGLGIEDGKVIYNGCLLENLGTSQQMLVCSSIALNDILAHKMHLVRLDGIESMSPKDYAVLEKLFNSHGIQVCYSRVSRGDVEPDEIVIVDGEYTDEGEI